MTLLKKLLKPLVPKTAKNRNHHVKERHRKHSRCYFYYLRPPARPLSSRPRNTHTTENSPHHSTTIFEHFASSPRPLAQFFPRLNPNPFACDQYRHSCSLLVRSDLFFHAQHMIWWRNFGRKRPKLCVFGGENQPFKCSPRGFRGNNNQPHYYPGVFVAWMALRRVFNASYLGREMSTWLFGPLWLVEYIKIASLSYSCYWI